MTALIGTIIFVATAIIGAIGLGIRAYLMRDTPIYTSKHGIRIYSDSPMPVDYKQFSAIVERLIVHMSEFFDAQSMRGHVAEMTCHFAGDKIPVYRNGVIKGYNGVCRSQYNIEVYHLAVDLDRTALDYELLNALIWHFCGYNIAVDEGGTSRLQYDDWYKQMKRQ